MYVKLARLRDRRIDNRVKLASALNEAWEKIQDSEPVRFALGAMQPIDPDYTKKSFDEANRVANQLQTGLTQALEFDYQGSTTNDTHIKAVSDIDLLAVLAPAKLFFVEHPLSIQPGYEYRGSASGELFTLKQDSSKLLSSRFREASVKTGAKCVSIEGGSLARKVDVVPCAWLDTVEWRQTSNKVYRGIKVYDSEIQLLINNKPFLHNEHLNQKDRRVSGGMRKTIRLLKTLKAEADTSVELSSYHICGIVHSMPDDWLLVPSGYDLRLIEQARRWCEYLRDNPSVRESLKMPNQTDVVFGDSGAKINGLNQMIAELVGLERDIIRDNRRSLTKLSEARYELPYVAPFVFDPRRVA